MGTGYSARDIAAHGDAYAKSKIDIGEAAIYDFAGYAMAEKHDHGHHAVTKENQDQGSKKLSSKLPKHAGSGNLPQLRDTADFNPFHDEDVAVVIETRSVRSHKLPRDELRPVVGGARRVAWTLAHADDDLVLLVQNMHGPRQIGHHNQLFALMEITWQTRAFDDVDGPVV